MRVLSWLIKISITLLIVAVIGFLVSREILLSVGVSKLSQSVQTLRNHHKRGTYYDVCTRKGSQVIEGSDFVTYQIRFTSSSEYVLEAVCSQLEFDPILIEKQSLPRFVTKIPGQSGFIFSRELVTGVDLGAFYGLQNMMQKSLGYALPVSKQKKLALKNMQMIHAEPDQYLDEGPISSCSGYGYVCCDNLTQQGVGEQISGLVSCDQTCFSSCVTRPSLLSFTTSPIFDPKTRKLQISKDAGVEFNFVVDEGNSNSVFARVDFGDGEEKELKVGESKTTHRYLCRKNSCLYKASIELEDEWGVRSVPSSISSISIEVL
jgi:hypothetical protein